MKIINIYGVDVSKDSLDICLLSNGKIVCQLKIKNTTKEISKMVLGFKKEGFKPEESLFCLEHTGIYNNVLLSFLHKRGYSAWVESARQIVLSGGMLRGKTDEVDAVRIALYAAKNIDQAKIWKPRRDVIEILDALLKNRRRMMKVKNQLSVSLKESKKFVSKQIAALNDRINRQPINIVSKAIKDIDVEICDLIQSDQVLLHQATLAKSVTGVGEIIAATIIVKTDEFQRFDNGKKFACHAGVAPFDHRSGSSIRGKSRISQMADKTLKSLLHLAALAAITSKGELRQYYDRKVADGKNKMCVINAIRNKIIQRIFVVVSRGTPYQKINNFGLHKP